MKRHSVLRIILILGVVHAGNCSADVVNGDFSAGKSSWAWRSAIVPGDVGDSCAASMAPFNPTVASGLSYDASVSYLGNFAKVTGTAAFGMNSQTYCRQIEQTVYVPPGSILRFDAEVARGNLTSPQSYAETVFFRVLGQVTAGGSEDLLYLTSGASTYCGYPAPTPGCRGFRATEVDVSRFWGKTISLRFRTHERRVYVNDKVADITEAYIDNIRLEQRPVINLPAKSGSWYNPGRSGHGLHLSRAGNGKFMAIWYTYLSDGRPIWYISDTVAVINGVWQSPIFKSVWNPATGTNSMQPVGDVKFEMNSASDMTFSWDLYSINGNNTGFDGAEPFSFLSGGGSYTGLWYEPAYSGWGISLEYMDNPQGIDTVATAFYYDGTEPVWAQGAVEGSPTGNKLIELTQYTGIGLCPECVGQQTQMFPWPAGILSLSLDGGAGWIDAQSHSGNRWQRGSAAQPAGIVQMTGP